MRNLLKIVKEKIGKISGSDKKKSSSKKKSEDKSWDERRAELLEKARNKESEDKAPRGSGNGNNRRRDGQNKNKRGGEPGEHSGRKKGGPRKQSENKDIRAKSSNRPNGRKPKTEDKNRSNSSKSEETAPNKTSGAAPRQQNKNTPGGGGSRNRRRPRPKGTRPDKPDTLPKEQTSKPVEKPKIHEKWDPTVFHVEPLEGKTRFHDLGIPEELMHAVYDLGFKYCTPIQAEIMKSTISGKDAMGKAQTGTGKTAAFLITIFNRILREPITEERRNATPRALILAPTRELVMQIAKDADLLSKYSDINVISVFGGMDYRKQRRLLAGKPVDVVVATPGRLLDFYMKREIHLNRVEVLVIDEADRMLDMGFIPDVKKIIRSTPHKDRRQTLLFSATLTTDIRMLASSWTIDAFHVEIDPENVAVDTVDQKVYIVTASEKYTVLCNLIKKKNLQRVIVFANRRDETRDLEQRLKKDNFSCAVLSGDVDQRIRVRTLDAFKRRKS